ncbi:MAG: hypothetical protein HYU86_02305 [Chloroflexi bacterium]|nr:hypothetical protein [Chloroflexota bacterium]
MAQENNYWTEVFHKRISRRRALGVAARASLGVAGAALLGCAATPAPTPTKALAVSPAAATPTLRPAVTSTPVAKTLDKLVIAHTRDIPSLDPQVQSGNISQGGYWDMLTDTLVTLAREEESLKLVPGLATSWKVMEDDPRTWEFKLRQGVKFHNGEEFDADTVVYNIDRNKDPVLKLNMMPYVKDATAKAIDKYTARLTWPQPYPLAAARLVGFPIVPRKYIQENGEKIMSEKPIGTGYYKFVKWVKDDYVEMEWAGSHWRGKTPTAKTVIQKVIPEIAPRIAALQTGAADVIFDIPPDLVSDVSKDPNVGIYKSTNTAVPNFGISQMKEGPLRDKRVRLALNLAIDRETIVKTMFGGFYQVVPDTVVPLAFGYNADLKPYPYDAKKAKDLLAEAGYPNGFDTVIDMGKVAYPRYKEYTQAIAEYWRQIGVKATIRPQEGAASWSDWGMEVRTAGKGPEGVYLQGYCDCLLDADDTWRYYTTWDPKAGSGTYSWIEDAKLDKMVADSRSTMDLEKRKKLLQEIQAYNHEQAYAIPLWVATFNWGYAKKRIKNLYARLFRVFVWDVELA